MAKKLASPKKTKNVNISGRPVRSTRGTGGHRAQLEKASSIVGEGLLNKVTGQKRDRNNLIDIPEHLSENDLAPPIKTKRARTTKNVLQQTRVPDQPDRPLQAAPKPALVFAAKDSTYGFPAISASQTARPNRKPFCSKTNAQVTNSNESDVDMDTNSNNFTNSKTRHDTGSYSDGEYNNIDGEDHASDGDNGGYDEEDDGNDDNRDESDNGSDNDNGDESDDNNNRDNNDNGDNNEGNDDDNGGDGLRIIDEISPSEDERAAEAFLREGPPCVVDNLEQEEGIPHNVVAQHQKKNRSNKPPELSRLSTAGLHQANHYGQDSKVNTLAQESDDENQDKDQARAARHSKSSGEAKPDTMAYYRDTHWWAILTKAKLKYRRHIALNHGFPDRDEYLCDAHDILLEEIEEFKTENGILDNYQPVRAMDCLIFKEGATFRGRLKAVAHLAVEKAFRDDLNPPDTFESQRDLKYAIEQNVADLIKGGKFLMNGKDDAGRTNNLAHPCLRDICIDFFYTSKNALARTFPDDFGKMIPDNAIALAATTMRHCLQRYSSGIYIDCKFEGIIQNSVYTRMLALILQIRTNPYHKAKHNNNRRLWAKLGMQRLQPQTEVDTHDMDVILD